ncbi:hypothetical protein Hanom_Chr08g00702151 [Helianthus anomalus]
MRSDFCKIVSEMITTSIAAAGNYAIQVPVLWKDSYSTQTYGGKTGSLHYPEINGFWPELSVFRSYTSCHDLPIYLCFLGVSVPVGGGHAGFYICFFRHVIGYFYTYMCELNCCFVVLMDAFT